MSLLHWQEARQPAFREHAKARALASKALFLFCFTPFEGGP